MKSKNYLTYVLKFTALFLWYLVAVFIFIIWDMNQVNPILKQGTVFGDAMVRFPYQWDFELFFAGLFLVWGIFIWKASQDITNNINLIKFTGWAFLIHVVTMIIAGLIKFQDFAHLLIDSITWFVCALLILFFAKKLEY